MKRLLILLVAVCGFATTTLSAQNEVRGVETKLVQYDGPEYEDDDEYSGTDKYSTKWFGYSFYNMNSIPVSVDAELYREYWDEIYRCTKWVIVDTKTFVLQSKETYIWKHEKQGECDFKVNSRYDGSSSYKTWWTDDKVSPNYRGYDYRVEYKAYKLE